MTVSPGGKTPNTSKALKRLTSWLQTYGAVDTDPRESSLKIFFFLYSQTEKGPLTVSPSGKRIITDNGAVTSFEFLRPKTAYVVYNSRSLNVGTGRRSCEQIIYKKDNLATSRLVWLDFEKSD